MRLLLVPLLPVAPPCAAQAVTIATEHTGESMLVEGSQPFTSISCGVFGPDWPRASQEDARRVTDTASTAARRTLSATVRVPGARARPPAGGRARAAISEPVLGAD